MTVLGPMHFLVDVNDISIWSRDSELLQAGTDAVSRSAADGYIPLNISKTMHMVFGHTKIDQCTFLFDRNPSMQILNGHKILMAWQFENFAFILHHFTTAKKTSIKRSCSKLGLDITFTFLVPVNFYFRNMSTVEHFLGSTTSLI